MHKDCFNFALGIVEDNKCSAEFLLIAELVSLSVDKLLQEDKSQSDEQGASILHQEHCGP